MLQNQRAFLSPGARRGWKDSLHTNVSVDSDPNGHCYCTLTESLDAIICSSLRDIISVLQTGKGLLPALQPGSGVAVCDPGGPDARAHALSTGWLPNALHTGHLQTSRGLTLAHVTRLPL